VNRSLVHNLAYDLGSNFYRHVSGRTDTTRYVPVMPTAG
jgi:hypothetical protein